MTDLDVSKLSIEDRLALLEARLATPFALVPPITVGELLDVPAPGSQIAAQWAQEVSGRIIHRFANVAAVKAWAAPVGSRAVAVDTGVEYRRIGGVWNQATPWVGSNVGVALNGQNPGTAATLNIPADDGPRFVVVSCVLKVDVFPANRVVVQLRLDGLVQAETVIPASSIAPNLGLNMEWTASMSASGALATGRVVPVAVVVIPDAGSVGSGIYHTVATSQHNRVDALITPRGF